MFVCVSLNLVTCVFFLFNWHYAYNIDDDDDKIIIIIIIKVIMKGWVGSNMLEVLHCFIFLPQESEREFIFISCFFSKHD